MGTSHGLTKRCLLAADPRQSQNRKKNEDYLCKLQWVSVYDCNDDLGQVTVNVDENGPY